MNLNFSSPYPCSSPKSAIVSGVQIGFFVFLFLSIFQPFGTAGIVEDALKYYIYFGFGLITVFSVLLLTAVRLIFLKSFFKPQNWTIGKEVIWVALNFLVIGIFNFLYSIAGYQFIPNWATFFSFIAITVLVGAFPYSILVLLRHNRLLKQNLNDANWFNQSIKQNTANNSASKEDITIKSDLKDDDLTLNSESLIFAQAVDNYVEFFILKDNKLEKKLIRCTLKSVEEQTENVFTWIRCHRKYLVNLNLVDNFYGNAQGLKLQLPYTDFPIPVSRKYVAEIKKMLSRN